MALTTQERQALETEFSKKVVDEAVELVKGRNQSFESKLNKDGYRALIQLWFT